MNINISYEIVRFSPVGRDWLCLARNSQTVVGTVERFPTKRGWVFKPSTGAVLDEELMNEVLCFMNELKKENRRSRV